MVAARVGGGGGGRWGGFSHLRVPIAGASPALVASGDTGWGGGGVCMISVRTISYR